MTERTGYAVLRFVTQNSYCHLVHDYAQGSTVMEYAKANVILDKKRIFSLIKKMASQLEQFYKCEEDEAYGYVNPYAVVITEQDEVLLLDIWAEENREYLAKMQKKNVRTLFVTPEYVLSQKKRKEDDWYGFGKTTRFLVEKCCEEKVFTYKEIRILNKLYGKCANGEKAEISKWIIMQDMVDKLLQEKKKRGMFPVVMVMGCIGTFAGGVFLGTELGGESVMEKNEVAVEMKDEFELEKAEEYLNIGLLCMEAGSKEADVWFERAAGKLELAEVYLELNTYLQKESLEEEEKEALTEFVDASISKIADRTEYHYRIPFIRAYMMIENEKAMGQVILLGEHMEQTEEVKASVAKANYVVGNSEAAIIEYEDLKKIYDSGQKLKVVYEMLMELYDSIDLPEKVKENYEEAVKLMPKLAEDETFVKWKEVYGIAEEQVKEEIS